MIVIKNASDYKRHLQNRIEILEGQLNSVKIGKRYDSKNTVIRVQGLITGLKEALEVFEAWEIFQNSD
jgi:DNA-binding FrmR family transcriptional regulator